MQEIFPKILSRHTADVLSRVTDCIPDLIQVTSQPPSQLIYELSVGIDFTGRLLDEARPVGGYMICGAVKRDEVGPLLAAIAAHLGLGADILETPEGPQNILNEFLNIVIGLTGADWAGHGFEINFSTPRVLSGRPLPASAEADQAFHISVSAPGGPRVDIVVVFNDRKTAGPG